MAFAPFGRLNDQGAAIELQGCVTSLHGDGKLRPLAHLDKGLVPELEHKVRARRGSQNVGLLDFGAGGKGLKNAVSQTENISAHRVHYCAASGRRGEIVEGSPSGKTGGDNQ